VVGTEISLGLGFQSREAERWV